MLIPKLPGSIRFRLVTSLVVGPLMAVVMVSVTLPTAARADVTITSATTGPVSGDGGTFTVTPTGTISGTGNGIVAQSGNVITTLTVDGVVVTGTAASGVQNSTGSTVSAMNVSGTIQGGWAIRNDGSIGSINNTGLIQGTREFAILGTTNSSVGGLTNSGTIESVAVGTGGVVDLWTTGTVANLAGGVIRSAGRNTLYLNGATTLLTNAGTISSGSSLGHGIEVTDSANLTTAVNSGLVEGGSAMIARAGAVLGTLTNSGTFRGSDYGIWFASNSGTVSNLAGGLIEATGYAAIEISRAGSRVASFDNAGTIRGINGGIVTDGIHGFTSLTNSGTISSSSSAWGGGLAMYHSGTTATLSNSGLITSVYNGIDAYSGTITTLVNSGTVSGDVYGIFNDASHTISTLTNEATGLIQGNDTGLYVSSTTTAPMEVTNAGLISGGTTAGVRIVNSRLLKLTNTGTISFTGTNAGPAVLVGPGSVLGISSGTGGVALSSTGAAAQLNGTVQNQGTVYYGFTVDNQNLTVSAGGGAGTFTDGTLTVTNGNLTFTSGTSTVAAGVLANAGGGTVITDANATVRFIGLANRTANFQSIANSGVAEFQQAVAGSLAVSISGTGSVLKTGTGNLTLTGSSNYTGATSVAAGRLSVNGALGNSPVTVLALAELGGSGSIAGPVSVANGGSLSPGNSIQSLATGTATFAAGATFEYEVDSTNLGALSTAADLLVVSSDLNLDPGNGTLLTFLDLATTPNPFVAETTIFALINYSGNWNGGLFTYGGDVLADGDQFMVGSQQWQIDYNRTSVAGIDNFTSDYLANSKFVAITAVPEPSTCIMAVAGLACGGYLVRRRKQA